MWLPDNDDVWVAGEVVNPPDSEGKLVVAARGTTSVIDVSTGEAALPPLRNPDILIGC